MFLFSQEKRGKSHKNLFNWTRGLLCDLVKFWFLSLAESHMSLWVMGGVCAWEKWTFKENLILWEHFWDQLRFSQICIVICFILYPKMFINPYCLPPLPPPRLRCLTPSSWTCLVERINCCQLFISRANYSWTYRSFNVWILVAWQ